MSENNDIAGGTPLGELRKVEGDLAGAAAEEHQLQARIEEIAEELARESKIKVNSRPRTVEGHVVSFEEVVKLAFPSGPTKPNTKFTVTYRHAAQVPYTPVQITDALRSCVG